MKPTTALRAFGLNVRRKREAKKLTQEALAEKAGLHPTYLSGVASAASTRRFRI
jgi:transcriptional regulator with XRE-family HTH domain